MVSLLSGYLEYEMDGRFFSIGFPSFGVKKSRGGMSGVNQSVAREPVKESAPCADSDAPATIPIAAAA
jgi:hypothetical protein